MTHNITCISNRLWGCMFGFMLVVLCPSAVFSQTRLWASGSAVPGGTQELTRFAAGSRYMFKFHGKLLPGTLRIQSTEKQRASTIYYGPKQVDSNIVNDGISVVTSRDSTVAGAWTVLFEADNYRFTYDTSSKQVTGEIFPLWYEAWIVGGCVEDKQGSGSSAGNWQLSAGKAMTRSDSDPYEWTWTGELRIYKYNVEPNRLKINGQYGWTPKALHPLTADQLLTSATQIWYMGPDDSKWTIAKDGFYTITINVFKETIEAVYLGEELPDGILPTHELDADISVAGRSVMVNSSSVVDCRLYTLQGDLVGTATGSRVNMSVPAAGVYLIYVSDGKNGVSRKILID